MEILGKAARVFLGIPVERSDNTGTAMLFERFLLEQNREFSNCQKYERPLARPKGAKST